MKLFRIHSCLIHQGRIYMSRYSPTLIIKISFVILSLISIQHCPCFQVYLIIQDRQIMSPHSSVVCISKCIEQEKWVPHWWQPKEIGSFASFCMVWRPNNQHIVLCHNGNFGKQTKAKIDRFLSAVHGGATSNIPGWLFQSIEQKAFCSFRAETKTAFK